MIEIVGLISASLLVGAVVGIVIFLWWAARPYRGGW